MEALTVDAVVDHHVEAARHRDQELMQALVGMAAALGAAGHVVEVVDALDPEVDVPVALDEGEIAARVLDLREVDDAAARDVRLCLDWRRDDRRYGGGLDGQGRASVREGLPR